MKLTKMKSSIAKLFTAGFLAAAVAIATPTRAEAQFGIAVHVGPRPIYERPYLPAPPVYGYYGRGYYSHPYYNHPYYGWDHRAPFGYRHEDRRFYR